MTLIQNSVEFLKKKELLWFFLVMIESLKDDQSLVHASNPCNLREDRVDTNQNLRGYIDCDHRLDNLGWRSLKSTG